MTALPGTPEDVARRQLEAWVEALVGADLQRAVVELDARLAELSADQLRAAVESGAPVLLAVRDADPAVAAALADSIGAVVAGEQRLVHGSVITAPGASPPGVDAPVGDGRPRRVLLTANVEPEALTRAASAELAYALDDVHGAQLERLEAAYWSLRRANARLTRDNLGRHDAAGASVVARLGSELAATKHRLETEIEVARRNDEYFQAARAKLDEPHHRAAEKLVQLLSAVPGGQKLSRRALSRGR